MPKSISIKKGTLIESPGSLNSKIYKVQRGLLRSYVIDEKGKEHIFLFASEGWTIADSVANNQPSELFIDALEDGPVAVFPKEDGHIDTDNEPLFRRIAALQKRVLMLMSNSAIERYEYFVSTYPDIVQRVPQKMIASYLGITPEALSKVKSESYSKNTPIS
jgi:CRP-like cAMP-binding protein